MDAKYCNRNITYIVYIYIIYKYNNYDNTDFYVFMRNLKVQNCSRYG